MWKIHLFAALLFSKTVTAVSPIVNRELETSVVAHKWPSTPQNVLCEAFVYHSEEHKQSFLDALLMNPSSTYEQAVKSVLEATPLQGISKRLLQTALSMRAHSPHCEMYRTIARETLLQQGLLSEVQDAFVVVGGKAMVKDLESVDYKSLLKVSFDNSEHILSQEKILFGTGPAVLLYANFGSETFAALYKKFQAEHIPVVVRYLGVVDFEEDPLKATGTVLQGYGVRLDIRNVEYKVFDDRSSSNDTEGTVEQDDDVDLSEDSLASRQFLAGLNLTQLDATDLLQEVWSVHQKEAMQASIIPPVWRRRHLPLQAATAIVEGSTDSLVTLQQISQDLPSLASTLVHLQVPDKIREAATFVQEQGVRAGTLFINGLGMAVDSPSFNVFEVLNRLQEEQVALERMQEQLAKYLPSKKALKDVQAAWAGGEFFLKGSSSDDNEDPVMTVQSSIRIDVGHSWRKGGIIYLNDIEKDPEYASWPTSTRQMIMGMQMGGPPTIRRNLFTVLSIIDPIHDTHNAGLNLALQLSQNQYPARMGVLLIDKDHLRDCAAFLATNKDEDAPCPIQPMFDVQTKLDELEIVPVGTQAVQRLVVLAQRDMAQGKGSLQTYFEYILGSIRQAHDTGVLYSLKDLLEMHGRLYEALHIKKGTEARADAIKNLLLEDEDEDYLTYGRALRFAVERGLKPGMSFLNGRPMPTDIMDESVNRIFGEEQNHIMQLIVQGKITDRSPRSVYGFLLQGDNVFKKSHPLLGDNDEGEKYVDLKDSFEKASLVSMSTDVSKPNAVFVVDGVFDLGSISGTQLASKFLSVMTAFLSSQSFGDSNVSISYRILPSNEEAAKSPLCPLLAQASMVDSLGLKGVLEDWNSEMTLESIVTKVGDLSSEAIAAITSDENKELCSSQNYLTESLPGDNFVLANGRVLPLEDSSLSREDIELLFSVEMKRSKAVTRLLSNHLSWEDTGDHNSMARVASFLSVEAQSPKSRSSMAAVFSKFDEELSDLGSLRLSWNSEGSENDDDDLQVGITAIIDPVSEGAQRISPILRLIRDQLKLPLDLLLAPPTVLEGDSKAVPLTSYYRFVMDLDGPSDVVRPTAHFSNLPTKHVLTLRTDVPEPWDVQQTSAVQDTDNLRCDLQSGCGDDGVSGTVDAPESHLTSVEYGLNSLLVFGQCYEASGSPPNGLQLTIVRQTELGLTKSKPRGVEVGMDGAVTDSTTAELSPDRLDYADSLVMKTVGYWQLRANPGAWKLSIAEKSQGANMFDMVEGSARSGQLVVEKDSAPKSSKALIVKDFVNRGELLVLQRRPGINPKASVIGEFDSVAADDGTVHVFSLATGHLYERFLKIMMLSVTKRTTAPVKFWLFENFLSPTFKASAKAMAKRIGCEVEFVTYKWPQWLRGQSEKQRIIWGYKILFLDVLFPLNVKKIIYVDADQVVRGDLKELWDMDLQGAPYGYTPFCSSREETLGYQFWRDGFWKTHLRGKPYHISALYVVDLELFRQNLVGDTLRSIYQQLSADPASLSNLDQDLPNYAQHSVPIFSLPQEWLWCESWCDDASKAAAKTIDLCNNPMHKEPKVSMAKRVISGDLFEESWVELDAEVEKYDQEFLAAAA